MHPAVQYMVCHVYQMVRSVLLEVLSNYVHVTSGDVMWHQVGHQVTSGDVMWHQVGHQVTSGDALLIAHTEMSVTHALVRSPRLTSRETR